MKSEEVPVVFDCDGQRLVGILHRPASPARRGLVLVVGGPQYRVGSHRQFLLLARDLAVIGIPVLRFDYRGMGDSEGDEISFEDAQPDLRKAIDLIFEQIEGLSEVVLWGLCDAASISMIYAHSDPRVRGLVLLNPWVRTDAGLAKTYLRHYYASNLLSRDFWRRMFSGRFEWRRAASEFVANVRSAFTGGRKSNGASGVPFTELMKTGLREFDGQTLFILSGDDLTAAEFKDHVDASEEWRRLINGPRVRRIDFPDANHTFSRREWRAQVSEWTAELVNSL